MKKIATMVMMMAVIAAVNCYVSAADEAKKKDAPAADSKAEVKAQTKCPVMGGDIDKSVYADHSGKRVYFCCKGCDSSFKKDPEKYIKQLEDSGVTLDKTPVSTDDKAKTDEKKSVEKKEKPKCGRGCC